MFSISFWSVCYYIYGQTWNWQVDMASPFLLGPKTISLQLLLQQYLILSIFVLYWSFSIFPIFPLFSWTDSLYKRNPMCACFKEKIIYTCLLIPTQVQINICSKIASSFPTQELSTFCIKNITPWFIMVKEELAVRVLAD